MIKVKHPRRLIVFGILAIVIVAAIIGVKQVIGGSAEGTITTTGTTQQAAAEPATTMVAEQGKYASFNYPSYFTPQKSEPAITPVLVNYNYIKSQIGSWQLAIQISSLSTGNLDDNGSYHYRKITPSQYVFTTQTVNGKSVPFVTDKTLGGYNQVAYLTNGSKVASVSLLGSNGQDTAKMDEALKSILASWQWL